MSGRPNEFRDPGAEMRLEEMIRIVAARPGIQGAQGPSGTVPIFANIAALTASSIVGLATGTMAVVTSVGALWYLDTTSALTTDGITIVATSGAGRWLRGPTINPEAALAQVTWFIDETNGTGTASDENTGLTSGTALLTKGELSRRYGTITPRISQTTTVTFSTVKAAGPEGLDPWLIQPICTGNGTQYVLQFALPASPTFTGTLNTVTAKNQAGNSSLQSTFTTSTGAISAGMYLVNTTRSSSVSFSVRNISAGNWLLDQPLAAWGGAGTSTATAENNAWANGDSINGYALPAFSIPVIASIGGTGTSSGIVLYRLSIGTAATDFALLGGTKAALIDCNMTCLVEGTASGGSLLSAFVFNNVDFSGILLSVTSANWRAGSIRGSAELTQSTMGNDMVVAANTKAHNCILSTIAVDTGFTLTCDGRITRAAPSIVYGANGAGTFNSAGVTNFGGTTATLMFPITTIQLDGVATGYSMKTSAGTTAIAGGISLTGANIDAAAGPTGFGGSATNLAGASITNGTQP